MRVSARTGPFGLRGEGVGEASDASTKLYTVGVNRNTYLERRNFVSLPLEKYSFRKVYDPFKVVAHLYHRVTRKASSHWIRNLYYDFGLNNCDLLHFFNTLNLGKQPWIVSFSSFVPRWKIESGWELGMKLLARPQCKQLLALSHNSYRLQHAFVQDFPAYRNEVLRKTRILHPAQRLLIEDYADKVLDSSFVVFTFVGRAFFRKGGMEALEVAAQLLDEGYPLKLNIISTMQYGDYASRASHESVVRATKLMEKYPDNIFYARHLPNAEVLALFRHSHVGLLPTYDDAYGYSVLEAQAAGCPVITTNVRALPEINDEAVGWLLDVPQDELGRGLLDTALQRQTFSAVLREQLYVQMKQIMEMPQEIGIKGRHCLEKIASCNDPDERASILEAIYDQALGLAA